MSGEHSHPEYIGAEHTHDIAHSHTEFSNILERLTALEGAVSNPPPIPEPLPNPEPEPPGEFNPLLDMFRNDPFYGSRISESAVREFADAQANNLSGGTLTLNCRNGWGRRLWEATGTEPPRTITVHNRNPFRFPHYLGFSDPGSGGNSDGNFSILDTDGLLYNCYDARPWGGEVTWAVYANVFDPAGSAFRPLIPHTNNQGSAAGGACNYAGRLEKGHFERGFVGHALSVSLVNSKLKSGPVSPALGQDTNGAAVYSGLNPMGTRICLPKNFNMAQLSPEGRVIAEAFRDYGGWVMDRSGSNAIYCGWDSQPYLDKISSAERALIWSSMGYVKTA